MPDTPVKDRKDTAADVEAKQQLVDCIRMLERSDIIDYNGHASIRAGDDRLLINIGSCQRASLTVADICTIDMEGNVIEGNGKPPLEFHLHAGVYRARPDVKAVVHAHPKWSTFLTMVGQPALDIDLHKLPQAALAADIIYTPLETPFIAAARARGLRTINGLGMLLHQGRPAWQRWFGMEPEVTAELRSLMEQSLA